MTDDPTVPTAPPEAQQFMDAVIEDARRPQTIRIVEVFGPTIQGEGSVIGQPTVFVRSGGCDFRCAWCDTMYAVDPKHRADWRQWAPWQIADEVDRLAGGPILVTLSGGNPALQPFGPTIDLLHARGHRVTCETQGTVAPPWFAKLDDLTISPKPPSAGQHPVDPVAIRRCAAAYFTQGRDRKPDPTIKVVVFDQTDLAFVEDLRHAIGFRPLYLQVGTPQMDAEEFPTGIDAYYLLRKFDWLASQVIARRWYDVVVLPQLHALVWGNARAR